MSILDLVKADIEQITQDTNGFGVEIQFRSPVDDYQSMVTVVGTKSRHHMSFDEEGVMTSSTNAHVAVTEKAFEDAGYVIRDPVTEELNLLQHSCSFVDANGVRRYYLVMEQYPDDTVGLIVLILNEVEGDEN